MLPQVLAATYVDSFTFGICAVIVLAGAAGVILSRNPVHSALMLVMTLFGVAVLFVAQEAHFLAAVQVIVYAGAIVVLFLFVIMLIGVDRVEDTGHEPLRGQRVGAAVVGLLTLLMVVFLARSSGWVTGTSSTAAPGPGGGGEDMENVELLGRAIFTDWILAFEVTSLLLVIAVVGAVVLAKKPPAPLAESDESDGARR